MAPAAVERGPASGPQVELKPDTENENGHAPPSSRSHEEYQYLELIREILRNGEHRPDRTGTGTLAIPFPPQHKYSLSRPDGTLVLPLLTTKRVFFRAVLAELLWFVSGDTNAKTLQDQNVKIWDGNASRAYLDSVGLSHREEGDLGPVYGFQWRHFGAEYDTCHSDYSGKGVDQLAEVIHKLKNSPYDRRIILSAWNPADLKKMALPPCHMFAQFYVSFPQSAPTRADGSKKGTLHSLLYQRSCDMGLGVPFNIASYALLTHMLARVCDLIPGSLTHTMGDAHVYMDHREALEVQITREPKDFPTLNVKQEAGCSIDGWKTDDFEVAGYEPHKGIAMKMSLEGTSKWRLRQPACRRAVFLSPTSNSDIEDWQTHHLLVGALLQPSTESRIVETILNPTADMSSADRADRRAECAALLETLEEKETKVKKDLEATRAHIEQAKADLGDRFKDIPGFAREIVMLYAVAPYTILEALLDKNIAETEEHTRRVREKAAMLEDTERHAEALEELQEKFRAL